MSNLGCSRVLAGVLNYLEVRMGWQDCHRLCMKSPGVGGVTNSEISRISINMMKALEQKHGSLSETFNKVIICISLQIKTFRFLVDSSGNDLNLSFPKHLP